MTPLWIFAYGSLLFRPDFEFSARVVGKVDGYSRRFWQKSTDHRGTLESPGRVVTLVEEPGAECWGVAYRIEADQIEDIRARLDHREKGGYSLLTLPFSPKQSGHQVNQVTCYVAFSNNPDFCGPEDDSVTAEVIRSSSGPSGHNVDYLLRLAEALEALGLFDAQVFRMANLVSDPAFVLEEVE